MTAALAKLAICVVAIGCLVATDALAQPAYPTKSGTR